jgi:hypothetical protein
MRMESKMKSGALEQDEQRGGLGKINRFKLALRFGSKQAHGD